MKKHYQVTTENGLRIMACGKKFESRDHEENLLANVTCKSCLSIMKKVYDKQAYEDQCDYDMDRL